MLDKELHIVKERILEPLAQRVAHVGLTPNQLTLISFAFGILAGHFCLEGRLGVAMGLWWLNRIAVGVDGAVARHLKQQTDFGAYLDIICDFIVYTTIPIDLAFWQVASACATFPAEGCGFKTLESTLQDETWGPLFWLLVSLSFLLGTNGINAASLFMLGGILEKLNTIAKTQGEKTTLTMPVGLIEGTETIIFYSLFIGLPQHLTLLFVLFGSLVSVTILQRLGWAYRNLNNLPKVHK